MYKKYGKIHGNLGGSSYSRSGVFMQSSNQITHEPILEGSEIDIDNSLVNSKRNTMKSEFNNESP